MRKVLRRCRTLNAIAYEPPLMRCDESVEGCGERGCEANQRAEIAGLLARAAESRCRRHTCANCASPARMKARTPTNIMMAPPARTIPPISVVGPQIPIPPMAIENNATTNPNGARMHAAVKAFAGKVRRIGGLYSET